MTRGRAVALHGFGMSGLGWRMRLALALAVLLAVWAVIGLVTL